MKLWDRKGGIAGNLKFEDFRIVSYSITDVKIEEECRDALGNRSDLKACKFVQLVSVMCCIAFPYHGRPNQGSIGMHLSIRMGNEQVS